MRSSIAPMRLLLIGDPLAGGAERGADLVDALREVLGIGREHRLLADQLDLLLDPRQLGVEEGQLAVGLAAPRDALLEQLGLTLQAAPQIVAERRIGQPPLQLGEALLEPGHRHARQAGARHRRRIAGPASAPSRSDAQDRLPRHQQPQVHPGEAAEAVALRGVARRRRVAVELLLEDRLAALRQRCVAALVGVGQRATSAGELAFSLVAAARRQLAGDEALEARRWCRAAADSRARRRRRAPASPGRGGSRPGRTAPSMAQFGGRNMPIGLALNASRT